MDEFKENFRSEGEELIGSLEEALLDLEGDFSNMDQISNVFRVMHSLKGGAGMFGFSSIEEITHDLETVYDSIRNGKFELSQDIFDVTYKVLDHLRVIIHDDELQEESNASNHQELLKAIKGVSGSDGGDAKSDDKPKEKKEVEYFFRLKLKPELIQNGSNPFFIVEDLSELGEVKVKAIFSDKANLSAFAANDCHLFWFGTLKGKITQDDIDELFMFIEDEIIFDSLVKKVDLDKLNLTSKDEDFTLKDIVARIEPSKPKATPKDSKPAAKAVESLRVRKDKLDDLMAIVSEVVTNQAALKLFLDNNPNSKLESITETMEKLSRQLRDNAFGLTLTPISSITTRFKRLIRDVASSIGKEIDFQIVGEETELDKTLVEKIVDPVMHMLRNSVDHGIEMPDDREAKGKSRVGEITLSAYYSGTHVNIEIKDDGKGIDPEIIFNKAVEKGIVSADSNMTDLQKLQLIFYPGFSTAEAVTDLSGRGVGMDVVRKNIEELRGEVLLTSTVGKGSVLTLKLPLTLSIIDGLIVELNSQRYIIPVPSIHKCFKIGSEQLEGTFNGSVELDGEEIPFLYLGDKFNIERSDAAEKDLIVIESGDQLVALVFDTLVGEIQAVIKPLGPYYAGQDYYSGCTILGDGSIALVLDPTRLVQNFAV